VREFFLDPPQERNGAKDLANGCRVDPDGTFKGLSPEEAQPLDQGFSERFLEEASDQEVRRGEDEKKRKKTVVKEIDHDE
jgi:hypothetical protein